MANSTRLVAEGRQSERLIPVDLNYSTAPGILILHPAPTADLSYPRTSATFFQ